MTTTTIIIRQPRLINDSMEVWKHNRKVIYLKKFEWMLLNRDEDDEGEEIEKTSWFKRLIKNLKR